MDTLIKSYEAGTIDFNDMRDVQKLKLKLQIDLIESIKGYYVPNYLKS